MGPGCGRGEGNKGSKHCTLKERVALFWGDRSCPSQAEKRQYSGHVKWCLGKVSGPWPSWIVFRSHFSTRKHQFGGLRLQFISLWWCFYRRLRYVFLIEARETLVSRDCGIPLFLEELALDGYYLHLPFIGSAPSRGETSFVVLPFDQSQCPEKFLEGLKLEKFEYNTETQISEY